MASLLVIAAILTMTISAVISSANIQQYPRRPRPVPRQNPRWGTVDTSNAGGVPYLPGLLRPGAQVQQRRFQAKIPDGSYPGPPVQVFGVNGAPVGANGAPPGRKFYPEMPKESRPYPAPQRNPPQESFAPGAVEAPIQDVQLEELKKESLEVRQNILDELRSLRQMIQVQNQQGTSRRSPMTRYGAEDDGLYEAYDDGIGLSLDPDLRPKTKTVKIQPERMFKNPHSSQFRDFWDYDDVPSADVIKPDPVVLGGRN